MNILALLFLSLAVCEGLRQLDAEDLFPVDDLTTANPDGYAVFGTTSISFFGNGGINLGDINGDGLDDLIFDHASYDADGSPGRAIVLFGDDDPGKTSMTDDTAAASSNGFNITSKVDGVTLASKFATGDFNADGRTDILVSSPSSNAVVVLLWGPVDNKWEDIVVTTTMNSSVGVIITNDFPNDYFGHDIANIGDFNNDSYEDFAMSTPNGASLVGEVYIVFGGPSLTGGTLDETNSLIITGPFASAGFGNSLATGDFNGDSYTDLVVGASAAPFDSEYNIGRVYVIFGGNSSYGVGEMDMAEFVVSDSTGMYIDGDVPSRKFGAIVDAGCDVNGDGIEDVIIGSTTKALDVPGIATILFGKTTGFEVLTVASLNPDDGFVISGGDPEEEDSFGQSVGFLGYLNDDVYGDYYVSRELPNSTYSLTVFFGREEFSNFTVLEEEPNSLELLNTYIAFDAGNHLGNGSSSFAFADMHHRTSRGSAFIIKDFLSKFITQNPTMNPTVSPTTSPTVMLTQNPTLNPTVSPSLSPSVSPSRSPSVSPTVSPTSSPTGSPTVSPSLTPSASPTISQCEVSIRTTGGTGLSWDLTDDEGDEEFASGTFGGDEVEFTLIATEEYLLFLSSDIIPEGSTITVTVNEQETVIPLDGVTAATEIAGVTCESITNKIASSDSAYYNTIAGVLALFMALV